MTTRVLCQQWEESERGWGVRPDGCSLHLTEEDRRRFVAAYWSGMPDTAPDEYSRPCGEPYWVPATPELVEEIRRDPRGGIWKGRPVPAPPPGMAGVWHARRTG